MKVAFSSNYPHSVIFGGFEVQASRIFEELVRQGVDIELLRWHDREQTFDLLHLFGWSPVWWDVVEHWHGRGPLVLSMVGGLAELSGWQRASLPAKRAVRRMLGLRDEWARQQALLLKRADRIICVSDFERGRIVEEFDLPPAKVVVIPHGIDPVFREGSPEAFREQYQMRDYILFVGTITARKNPLLLAEAINALNLSGVFIGGPGGGEADYVRRFGAAVARTGKSLWLRGLPAGSELLASAYAGARVFCLPSGRETQPIAALEAAAAGAPIILGDHAYAHSPLYAGAVVVRTGDVGALKATLDRVHRTPGLGLVAPNQLLSWSAVARSVRNVYENLSAS